MDRVAAKPLPIGRPFRTECRARHGVRDAALGEHALNARFFWSGRPVARSTIPDGGSNDARVDGEEMLYWRMCTCRLD